MNKQTILGLLTVALALLGLTFLLTSDSHFPLSQWPYEAFQGLVFSLVWGFGVSTAVGYTYSVLIVLSICVVSFAIGHKLARIFSK